ncbi:MAG: preprotein translocase subunit SecE [Candidatus Magasanikbacteria bacterium]
MWQKTKTFLKESRKEFEKISWPTRGETIQYTAFVIVFSLVLSAILGFLDFIFTRLISYII